jgi:Family of unknown function (DUF6152)
MHSTPSFSRFQFSRLLLRCLPIVPFAAFLLAAPALSDHHGLAAFDTAHTVKMQGTVTEFQWINPHAYMYADLKNDSGKVASWKLEMGSLGMLTRFGGWTPTTVKRGDQVTRFRVKDGSAYMSLGKIELPNGKTRSSYSICACSTGCCPASGSRN